MSAYLQDQQDSETLASKLAALPVSDRGFAESLLRGHDARGWSEKQRFWVHKLIARADTPATERRPSLDIEGAALIAFLDRAHEAGLKYPKIRLTADGEPLVLSRAGEASKAPGAVNITDGGPYGDNVWYGRIERDGTLTASRSMTDSVTKVLRALAKDPTSTAAAYGQRTGTCCMCARHLEDYRSVSVGYGPICAEKWGLPWGEITEGLSEYVEA